MNTTVEVSSTHPQEPAVRGCSATMADPRRLELLVRQHVSLVYRVLRQLGVASADLDDATQQVFVTLSRRLADLRPGSERAFLSAVAVRVASRWRRTHRRRHEEDDGTPVSQRASMLASPESLVERAQAEQLLLRILERIPEKLREVFVLFEIEEMSLREIGELLELPQGTVASRLRLARERFRSCVEKLASSQETRRAE